MNALAKVPPHHRAPVTRPEPSHVPHECPRCGVGLERALREVDLTVCLDDGAEALVTGHECGACGWCCIPEL
jgi:hypothetical protein